MRASCLSILFGLTFLSGSGTVCASEMQPHSQPVIDARWAPEFEAFAVADRAQRPDAGGIVFVGSSSVRLWDGLESQFPGHEVVIKRGFGGSRLTDCTRHLHRLVIEYRPRVVVLYAGENDLAEGASPAEVASSFVAFAGALRQALPATHIAYVSIKPSPSRASLLPHILEANRRIRSEVAQMANAQFIDIHPLMLDAAGAPRAELYREDRLHLNAAGYALWRREIAARLP